MEVVVLGKGWASLASTAFATICRCTLPVAVLGILVKKCICILPISNRESQGVAMIYLSWDFKFDRSLPEPCQ